MALPAQRVEMIPIDRITVVNPRLRNKKVFKGIVENIAEVGLKRPITVTSRHGEHGPLYDLVCGQGRLEAFRQLGQTEVPALIVTADQEDCFVASLVENCARRQHQAVDLLQDILGMRGRGYSDNEIAAMTGLSANYVYIVGRLLERGERRLVAAVEAGYPYRRPESTRGQGCCLPRGDRRRGHHLQQAHQPHGYRSGTQNDPEGA